MRIDVCLYKSVFRRVVGYMVRYAGLNVVSRQDIQIVLHDTDIPGHFAAFALVEIVAKFTVYDYLVDKI